MYAYFQLHGNTRTEPDVSLIEHVEAVETSEEEVSEGASEEEVEGASEEEVEGASEEEIEGASEEEIDGGLLHKRWIYMY